MARDLSNWRPRPRPERRVLEGRLVRLEPLSAARHGDDLFAASTAPDARDRFAYLSEIPPESRAAFQPWLEMAEASADPLYFAVVDKASGKAVGRQTYLRIDPANGVVEIGHIYWGPLMARSPLATEAQFLFATYVLDHLGYRRYEWKCNDANAPSKRAALRFGFTPEGLFRQHMIVKGQNRDTAWFSILDNEWPALRLAYAAWLDPANFDGDGRQIRRLEDIRAEQA
ncbi:GNAT family N-acetyltransferase [Marinivivus vitaminiproducens]|uniref:GNAT family N-acetyltransferase n=1 Tax=Marinivivus vitaminiproducens TaxID=3035935 RepID=UPI00279F26B5|nr:GNAT family protein [Geminicoccaceae bacterium SCSIO 64248]